MFVVSKRNGEIVDFNIQKIKDAIDKAFIAVSRETHPTIIEELSYKVAAAFGPKIKDGVISVEDIQDSVEEVLIKYEYADVAKAYILYRKKHEQVRKTNETLLDYKNVVDNYLNVADWRVKENSTVTYSVGGLILSNSGAVSANYWLTEVYDEEIANAHRNAEIHIHDLSMLTGYCAGWSLKQLIKEGLGGIPGKITSSPARHLSTLCNQMVNFLGIMQNEWAGAQAFSSFDTYLAPFVKADNLDYKEVKQCIQSFVYGVNTPSRWGTQSPFTNITLDWVVPQDLAELNAIVGGEECNFKYKDCKKEMDMINKAFIEVMLEGDANGRGFQYPIPTYSITKDFDWSETENNKLLFEMSSKYGTPYFSNYVNSDMEPSDVRSMCCRLRLDLRELRKKSGGFFGSGESTGSVGVVTINMPRLGFLANTEEEFMKRLDRLMDISARSLKVKRNTIEKFMENGLYPYTKRYLGTFNNHFSTIGLVGMNECCLNAKWLKKDLREQEAVEFSKRVLNHMRERLSDYQEQYGDLYNLEATPAESTSYRFAKHDKEKFPSIITANESGTPYYTNSSHLPVGTTDDIFKALDTQDELQTLYTSGTVFHTFLGEKLPDWRAAATLVRTIAENYKLPYYTLSPTYSVCKDHGYIQGEVYECPICGQKTEVNSRITGYYRPVQNWNDGKAQEFKDRLEYSGTKAVARCATKGTAIKGTEDLIANAPGTPITPVAIVQQTPVAPVQPVVEQAPVQPVAPVAPIVQQAPVQQTPVAPVQPVVEQAPVQPAAPVAPIVQQAPVTPVAKQAPVQPALVAPVQPVVEQAPVQPAAPVAPIVQQAPVTPVAQQAPVQPVVEQVPVQPAVEQAPVHPTTPVAPVTPPEDSSARIACDPIAQVQPVVPTNNDSDLVASTYEEEIKEAIKEEVKEEIKEEIRKEISSINTSSNLDNIKRYDTPKVEIINVTPTEDIVKKDVFNDNKSISNVTIEEDHKDNPSQDDTLRLFITKTCPNCRKAEELLDAAGLNYRIVDALENVDECRRLGIMQSPTLIVNGKDKFVGISNIIKYVEVKSLVANN